MEKLRIFLQEQSKRLVLIFLILLWLFANLQTILVTPAWSGAHIVALILGNLVFLATIAYLYLIVRAVPFLRRLTEEQVKKLYRISFWALGFLLFIIPFFFMIRIQFSAHNWDFFTIFNATSTQAGKPFLPSSAHMSYFLRYANNQFFSIVLNVLYAPLAHNTTLKDVAMTATASLLTASGVLASSLALKKIGSRSLAIFYHLIALGFTPFWFYGAQLYTDSATLPFVAFSLLFLLYAFKAENRKRQAAWFLAASVVAALGYTLKPTVLIVIAAALVFSLINRKWREFLLLLLIFLACFVCADLMAKAMIATQPGFAAKYQELYNFPIMHWIAMSWSPKSTTGGFKLSIREFTSSIPGKAAKTKADTALFLSNLKQQGLSGVLLQIGRKLNYDWLLPDLNASYYTYQHLNPLVANYFDYLPAYHLGNITGWLMLKSAQALYWAPIVCLTWFATFRQMFQPKRWHELQSIVMIAVFGLAFFLIIWEANARYLYHFTPLILMITSIQLWQWLSKRVEHSEKMSVKEQEKLVS